MEEVIDFLRNIYEHNDREWFNAHKEEYLHTKRLFDAFVEEMIVDVRSFDPSIGSLTVADCTWRIYRDTRFSHDKRPYKTQMGCYFAPHGKKGPFSGYYFHVGISDENGTPYGMIATGNYQTSSNVLNVLREDISLDQGNAFETALEKAKEFHLDSDQMLKRTPCGFESGKPYSKYFLYKNFCLSKMVNENYLLDNNFRQRLIKDFKKTKDFLSYLNRAIQYTLESEK